jgi:hypothetical protein
MIDAHEKGRKVSLPALLGLAFQPYGHKGQQDGPAEKNVIADLAHG